MAISEMKMQMVIANYFKSECDTDTSIRQAFEKGFRIGVKKGASMNRPQGEWIEVRAFDAFGGDEATWVAHGNPIAFHYCSECKEQTRIDEFGEEILSNYCPNCGAKMKGADDDTI